MHPTIRSALVLLAGTGAYMAAHLATRSATLHGMIAALFVLTATVAKLAAIPHPTWLWLGIILIPAGVGLGTRLARS